MSPIKKKVMKMLKKVRMLKKETLLPLVQPKKKIKTIKVLQLKLKEELEREELSF